MEEERGFLNHLLHAREVPAALRAQPLAQCLKSVRPVPRERVGADETLLHDVRQLRHGVGGGGEGEEGRGGNGVEEGRGDGGERGEGEVVELRVMERGREDDEEVTKNGEHAAGLAEQHGGLVLCGVDGVQARE